MSLNYEKIVNGPSIHEIADQIFCKPDFAKPMYFLIKSAGNASDPAVTKLSVYLTGVTREDGSGNNYIMSGQSGVKTVKLYYNTFKRTGSIYFLK